MEKPAATYREAGEAMGGICAKAASPLEAMLLGLPAHEWVPAYYLGCGYEAHVAASCHYVLRVFVEVAQGPAARRRWGWAGTEAMYREVMGHLASHRIGGRALHNAGFKSLRHFLDRLSPFRGLPPAPEARGSEEWRRALDSLPSRKLGMRNHARPDFHRALVIEIWRDGERQEGLGALPDLREVHRRYCHVLLAKRRELESSGLECSDKDFKPYTVQHLSNILNAAGVRLLHGGARYGKAWELREAAPHHHRGKPAPWAVLTGDGVTLGTLVAAGPGSPRSRTESLTVWIWRDWHSGATVGWAFGRGGESPAMVAEALGSVYKRYGRLPGSVQLDDKMRHKSGVGEMLERLGIRVMGKEAYRPQGLYAETGNRAFNRIHRQVDADWVNRTARSDDFRRAWEDLRPGRQVKSEAEAREMVEQVIDLQNRTPSASLGGRTPLEALALAGPSPAPHDPRYLAWYFGERRKAAVRRGVIVITPELSGERVRYTLEDYARHLPQDEASLRVYACWHGSEHQSVEVFTLEGKWIDTARRTETYNPDPLAQTGEDLRVAASQSREVERYKRAVSAAAAEVRQVLEEHDVEPLHYLGGYRIRLLTAGQEPGPAADQEAGQPGSARNRKYSLTSHYYSLREAGAPGQGDEGRSKELNL
jgi:hypothetical protein